MRSKEFLKQCWEFKRRAGQLHLYFEHTGVPSWILKRMSAIHLGDGEDIVASSASLITVIKGLFRKGNGSDWRKIYADIQRIKRVFEHNLKIVLPLNVMDG